MNGDDGEGSGGSARRVAEAWLVAVSRGDEEAALALSSPSIVYTVEPVMRYEGHEGVRDILEDFARLSGFVSITVLDWIDTPGVAALRRVEKYTLPDGVLDVPSCSFVEVSDGLVTRWSDHKNMQPLDSVAGL